MIEMQSRTGRKGPYAHYYVQISPNNESFVGKCTSLLLRREPVAETSRVEFAHALPEIVRLTIHPAAGQARLSYAPGLPSGLRDATGSREGELCLLTNKSYRKRSRHQA